MDIWQKQLIESLTVPAVLRDRFGVEHGALDEVAQRYPMRITPYYLGLIAHPGDAIWLQCIPDRRELLPCLDDPDPLHEERLSPVPLVVHRYPDRVLLLACGQCAVYCRFCTRKRKVGCAAMTVTDEALDVALEYIARTPAIRDVILSGGDPLLLEDDRLERLLRRLRAIPHVEIIRIGSRVPVTLPQRITEGLCNMLRRYHPLYFNTHFNHPRELTALSAEACRRLADAGVPLGNQTVLLRGVNDRPEIMRDLVAGLLKIRVRPYYLHHMDLAAGTGHFRTRIETGLKIVAALRGPVSGLAVPHYVIDAPGGKGKIPLLPEYLVRLGDSAVLRTPSGEIIRFPNREG
ncbi:KamA family radical SAM protein [Syntrophotalea acetylenica]|jgi:lysine 2,3-aminomutase|uniref:KamA family radical SAM protein n=1 Tax=Syntrophotalea acetylenica TaxID=29542 RepID=UPI002A36E770|nr:KamA family radical SAM protein [Syntrophotalea acetylenica]MDY0260921.1 KamA family radical SAM protein [Syntrophotalea acetylenica]